MGYIFTGTSGFIGENREKWKNSIRFTGIVKRVGNLFSGNC